MTSAKLSLSDYSPAPVSATHTVAGSPRREEAESFIRQVFARRYGADVTAFAPNLMLLDLNQRIMAAVGWRSAGTAPLFLERYLDMPLK
jgi:hypothetical protein